MADLKPPVIKEIYRLIIQPGLWRDYTTFSSPGIVSAQWFRWYHGRLKRIGGWKYIVGLASFTTGPDFAAYDSPSGSPFTEPSYPGKQYANQDLTSPWQATYRTNSNQPYDQYDFTVDGAATFYDGQGLSTNGYRIPRKALIAVLDNLDNIVVTADYNQALISNPPPDTYGGIAFANVISPVTPTTFVDGVFPQGYGYVPNTIYTWSLDLVNLTTGFTSAATSSYIVAHPSCPAGNIADETNNYVFIIAASNLVDNAVMTPLSAAPQAGATLVTNTEVSVSGGVCAVGPFLFAYGNNGLIRNSDINNPLYWANPSDPDWQTLPGLTNDVNVGNSKIVKGVPYFGMQTYAALFWSLDNLYLATFIGAPAVFQYDIVGTNVGILGQNSVVARGTDYFWIAPGRFLAFQGGQVQELPNLQNKNWFFNNINYDVANKMWGILNPAFTEIIWFVPMFGASECNYMIIYNYQDQCFYDSQINRSAGAYSAAIGTPLWFNNQVNATTGEYELYLQETGIDAIGKDGSATVIPSSFLTGDLGNLSNSTIGSPKAPSGLLQNWNQLIRVEPDALMSGEWNLVVQTRQWANSDIVNGVPILFDLNTTHMDMREQGRIMQIFINNDTQGGDFYLGDFMLTTNIGDCEGI